MSLHTTFPGSYYGNATINSLHYVPKGGFRFDEWKDGETPYHVSDPATSLRSNALARMRREHIREGMEHAWAGYKLFAYGEDEILPVTGGSRTQYGGIGTTLVDSLDTLWLMDMKNEFYEARDWVKNELTHERDVMESVFETTIRSLGGLLSAYDLSKDAVFLERAQDLGDRLLKAFESPTGIPYGEINFLTGFGKNLRWTQDNSIISEIGTLQVEFRYLAKVTGKREYAEKVDHVFSILKSLEPPNGLYPYFVNNMKNPVRFGNNKIAFGALGDSFYEYMLKIWLQGGKKEPMYREMYDRSMDGMHEELLQKTSPTGLWYIADKNDNKLNHKMDHLTCFMGGLLALGAYTDPNGLESPRAQRDLRTGKALTYTCYQMYARMPSGISPEWIRIEDFDFNAGPGGQKYILRPETVESFFILNKLTGDPIYREWGWEIFQSLEKYSKTDYAYGHINDVRVQNAKAEDRMESFFLAETMKYLYLLMDPDTEIDLLNKHVFNTEAHPLRTFDHLEDDYQTCNLANSEICEQIA